MDVNLFLFVFPIMNEYNGNLNILMYLSIYILEKEIFLLFKN
jgi:hypothetical protein